MDDLLKIMEDYAKEHRLPIIEAEGAALLGATVAARQPQNVLEIGTAIGYSALIMAGRAGLDARITTMELDADRAAVAASFIRQAGLADQIEILVGDAADLLPGLAGRFDFVFIDAAKGQYLKYLELLLDKLAPGAVVFADNVLFRGWVRGGTPPRRIRTMVSRLRDYLAFVSTDPRFATTVFPVGDGVAISLYQEEPLLEKN